MFSVPENDGHIMSSWERFLSGDEAASDALRRLIDDSWRRCQGASVDPGRYQAPPPIGENSLHTLRDECGELLSASAPVMASARDFLSETGTVMVLTDQSGTILNLEGDMSTRGRRECPSALRRQLERAGLRHQRHWHSPGGRPAGTDPFGRALLRRHQALVLFGHGDPRPLRRLHPRRGGRVRPERLLQPPQSGPGGGHRGRIENRLAKIELGIRYRLLEGCVDRLSGTSADGIIVFDRRGRAIKANGRASRRWPIWASENWRWPRTVWPPCPCPGRRAASTDERPEWMREEWLEPVIQNGEHIGAVLTLPGRRNGGGGRAERCVQL
jgi:hypothetical protein